MVGESGCHWGARGRAVGGTQPAATRAPCLQRDHETARRKRRARSAPVTATTPARPRRRAPTPDGPADGRPAVAEGGAPTSVCNLAARERSALHGGARRQRPPLTKKNKNTARSTVIAAGGGAAPTDAYRRRRSPAAKDCPCVHSASPRRGPIHGPCPSATRPAPSTADGPTYPPPSRVVLLSSCQIFHSVAGRRCRVFGRCAAVAHMQRCCAGGGNTACNISPMFPTFLDVCARGCASERGVLLFGRQPFSQKSRPTSATRPMRR